MRKKLTPVLLALTLFCTGVLSGCVTADPASDRDGKEITVAVSSDTGTMDPAGSIALTYLAYSVSALDGNDGSGRFHCPHLSRLFRERT